MSSLDWPADPAALTHHWPSPSDMAVMTAMAGSRDLEHELVEHRALVRGLLLAHAEECERTDALATALAHLVDGCTPGCAAPHDCRDRVLVTLESYRRARTSLADE